MLGDITSHHLWAKDAPAFRTLSWELPATFSEAGRA